LIGEWEDRVQSVILLVVFAGLSLGLWSFLSRALHMYLARRRVALRYRDGTQLVHERDLDDWPGPWVGNRGRALVSLLGTLSVTAVAISIGFFQEKPESNAGDGAALFAWLSFIVAAYATSEFRKSPHGRV
jgi:hypothetical protein